jgi:hypothetical protein
MHRWFVTSPSARPDVSVASTAWLGAELHAKEMGTTLTACGMDASSWVKLWDTPFSSALPRPCRDCLRVTGL